MSIFDAILRPNKPFEEFFKLIKADNILINVLDIEYLLPTTTMTVAQFFKFREELIKTMYIASETAANLMFKSRDLTSYKSGNFFGFCWFKGVFEDAYGVKLEVTSI